MNEIISIIGALTLFFLCVASALLTLTSGELLPAFIGIVGMVAARYWMGKNEEREQRETVKTDER
jgi:hypothetical protein